MRNPARPHSISSRGGRDARGLLGRADRRVSRPVIPRAIRTDEKETNATSASGSNGSNGGSVSELSARMREAQTQAMEEDERLNALMQNLRGQNLSNADFAEDDVEMRLIEVTSPSVKRGSSRSDGSMFAANADDEDSLPLVYKPKEIAAYWGVRPTSLITRITQLATLSSGFLGGIVSDLVTDNVLKTELSAADRERRDVRRAAQLRRVLTRLGPAYVKLGQALSIRPDLLSPVAMVELQKLCDKVPSFDSATAFDLICSELGVTSVYDIFEDITPEPVAAASLGQVYIAHLKERGPNGERQKVAVKVQRPYVLETVTIDLFVVRTLGKTIGGWFPDLKKRVDIVALLDEWAARFFEELDYMKEREHTQRFAESMAKELPQVIVPKTYDRYTSRRVLVSEWIEGEKLAQSTASDVGDLVNLGVICYLKQLLDTGFFHADPHPGNMIRTPDGRLAILDFGLMAEIDNEIKYGMIEAISHLIHRDYEAIVYDFVTLEFIPPGTDLSPILPVLSKVFDQALEGGGAKAINFQELAADLAQITFDYPFRIPPYFALIIRAIGVLEGIALTGDPDFAIVDEAYPYLSKMLLTDKSPRLQEALLYTIKGKEGKTVDVARMLELMEAFQDYNRTQEGGRGGAGGAVRGRSSPLKDLLVDADASFFRELLIDEVVKSIDALSRQQLWTLASRLGLQNAFVPVLLPGVARPLVPLAPRVTKEDEMLVANILTAIQWASNEKVVQEPTELLPLLPEVVPKITAKLLNRITARMLREIFVA